MNGGLVRLKEIWNEVTPSEKKVAQYILDYPEETIQLSVAELSARSGGSQAAIIRLCKSMGVKGYQELKLKVAGDLQSGEDSGYQEIRPMDSVENIVHYVSNNNIQSIRDTVKILDMEKMTQAIDVLHRAKRIFFFGLGASNIVAVDAQNKFMRINHTSFAFSESHLQLTSAVTMEADDVAVGISYSGEADFVIACLKKAKEAGAASISITKYGNNTLGGLADIPLFISSTENEIRSGATASRIAQLNVIDILYLGVASRSYDQSVMYLEKSRAALREMSQRK
ncbi:MurR/RpiR family transcriptional regulator [Cohnella faecalis]|uniref:MurR/RpiR family transcriptional regulator n=1 Tax=Cohnella faecalis TaxID=2315694 RepID=A0A398CK76_9BACL|nr:MurR/RpiR family transcriptional regulator [Cohnella faecalis]RIE01278.1 MurR/RpiR family transcriptional regulator [Cohnella faecalis]